MGVGRMRKLSRFKVSRTYKCARRACVYKFCLVVDADADDPFCCTFCCISDLTFFYQEYLGIFARPNVWGLRAQAMCPCESRARLFAFPVVRLCLGRNSRISRTSHSHSFSPFSFSVSGCSASPACALQDSSGQNYCALMCDPEKNDGVCGDNASCKSISGVGICTYDD